MQSGRGGVVASSRTSGEPIRRPGPIWLLPRPPITGKRSLLRSEYFATLIQAFFLSLGLQIALALAAILGFAGVVSSGASALAFALVDAAAMHNLRCGFLRFALILGERGIGREQGSYSGRNERSLYRFSAQHRSSLECGTAVIGPLPDGAGRWQRHRSVLHYYAGRVSWLPLFPQARAGSGGERGRVTAQSYAMAGGHESKWPAP